MSRWRVFVHSGAGNWYWGGGNRFVVRGSQLLYKAVHRTTFTPLDEGTHFTSLHADGYGMCQLRPGLRLPIGLRDIIPQYSIPFFVHRQWMFYRE